MPIYEYQCEACSHTFEVIQKVDDATVPKCPICGGPVRRLLSAPGLVFKGTGWYVTDHPTAERRKAMEADKKASGDGDAAKPSPSESKPAAKEKE